MKKPNEFIESNTRYVIFELHCDCGTEGELGIPHKQIGRIVCCPDCGAPYIVHVPRGIFGQPTLEAVLSN